MQEKVVEALRRVDDALWAGWTRNSSRAKREKPRSSSRAQYSGRAKGYREAMFVVRKEIRRHLSGGK